MGIIPNFSYKPRFDTLVLTIDGLLWSSLVLNIRFRKRTAPDLCWQNKQCSLLQSAPLRVVTIRFALARTPELKNWEQNWNGRTRFGVTN